jgi:hypothetical protein
MPRVVPVRAGGGTPRPFPRGPLPTQGSDGCDTISAMLPGRAGDRVGALRLKCCHSRIRGNLKSAARDAGEANAGRWEKDKYKTHAAT